MLSKPLPTCPRCRQQDKIYKVSLLYLEGTARLNHHELTNQPELDGFLADLLPAESSSLAQSQVLHRVMPFFTPPAGEKRVTRRIHPDGLMFFFGLAAVLLLYRMAVSPSPAGKAQLPVALILLAFSLLAYLLFRRAAIRRYEQQNQQEQADNRQIEQAVGRWMRLYFCSRDQGVFDPEQDRLVTLEQIPDLLRDPVK